MIKKTLCFIVENKHLYLDKVLAEVNFPMLFVCKDEENASYMAMCIDAYHLTYLIRKCEDAEIEDCSSGRTTLKDFWKIPGECWKVYTQNEISKDKVVPTQSSEIADSDLPDKNFCIKKLPNKHFH